MNYGLNQDVTIETIQDIELLLLTFSPIGIYMGSIEHRAVYVVSGEMMECFFKIGFKLLLYL